MREMTVRQAMAEKVRARKWWNELRIHDRNDLGDAFVLGTFDWREWGFERRPSAAFLNEVDEQRIHWEIMQS